MAEIALDISLVSLLLTIGYDYSKNKPILSSCWQILNAIWNIIIAVWNFKIKLGWLSVIIVIVVLILYLVYKFSPEENFKPAYKEGTFKNWKWTWDWKWSLHKNSWIISDLTPHCPNCDTPLIDSINIYEIRYECPRCNYQAIGSQCEKSYQIESIIIDNIKRGLY